MSKKKIFYVEVEENTKRWIAAVSQNKIMTKSYRDGLSVSSQIKGFEANEFPVYAIETFNEEANSFYFVNKNQLLELIRKQKEDTVAHEDHIYFTFYTFETDYFQEPTVKSLMGALEHTHVDNAFLQEETLTKSEYHFEICSLANNYDIDGLDSLFKLIISSNNDLAKYDLAHYGYQSIFWNLIYDYACNKLPESGIDLLLDLIENEEFLLKKKNWPARTEAHFVLLETACSKGNKEIIYYLRQLNKALLQLLNESAESTEEIYQKQASAYALVADALPAKHAEHWEKAILALQNGIHENPETADWNLYAHLIFLPVPEIDTYNNAKDKSQGTLQKYQKLEQDTFQDLLKKQEHASNKMPYLFALNLYNLKEYMEWEKVDFTYFPQPLYFYWLDQSVKTDLPPFNRIDLNEACHFFHNEGIRLGRVDLLEKAIGLYNRIIEKTEEYSYEIHYLATAMEDISKILYQSGKVDEANNYVNKARQIYEQYIDKVKANYSVHLHYGEFLERCFQSEEKILKPDLATLQAIAIAVEAQGKGFYSTPIFLRMRIALYENKEEEAIYHLTKSLILHELCIDSEVDQLVEEYKDSAYIKFIQFLLETQKFMKSVRKNYYYDPQPGWEVLKNMSFQETLFCWEKRQNEIKNRPQS